jgi:hypothetical protein
MQRCVDGTRDVTYCHCGTWCLVMLASYVRLTYVVSDPLTDLLRGCSLWLQWGGKMRTDTPLCLHYFIVCMDKCKSWLSSKRTQLVSLSKAWHVLWSDLHILQNDPPSSTQMDGPRVKCVERTLCSMTLLMRCLFTSVCHTLLQCITKIIKWIWKSFIKQIDYYTSAQQMFIRVCRLHVSTC